MSRNSVFSPPPGILATLTGRTLPLSPPPAMTELHIKAAIHRMYHNNTTIKALVVIGKDGDVRIPNIF